MFVPCAQNSPDLTELQTTEIPTLKAILHVVTADYTWHDPKSQVTHVEICIRLLHGKRQLGDGYNIQHQVLMAA